MPIPLAVAIPTITSLVGGIGNLFGNSRRTYTKQDLVDSGYNPINEGKLKGDLARLVSAQLKNRRSGIDSKNNQLGIKDAKAVYSNEEDILNNQTAGEQNIDQMKTQEDNKIASLLFQLNEGQEQEKPWGQNLFEGVLAGANLGTSIAKLIPDGGAKPSATPDPNKTGDSVLKGFSGLGETVKSMKDTVKNGLSSIVPQDGISEEDIQFENLLSQGWSVEELAGMGYKLPMKYRKKNASFINDEINN